MPFTHSNARATFDHIDTFLCSFKGSTCLCCLGDMVVVFLRLQSIRGGWIRYYFACELRLQFNAKWHFGNSEIRALGHLGHCRGIRPDLDKVSAIKPFHRPTSANQLQGVFINLLLFSMCFITGFPCGHQPLEWRVNQDKVFFFSKHQLRQPLLLVAFLHIFPTEIRTDAVLALCSSESRTVWNMFFTLVVC